MSDDEWQFYGYSVTVMQLKTNQQEIFIIVSCGYDARPFKYFYLFIYRRIFYIVCNIYRKKNCGFCMV